MRRLMFMVPVALSLASAAANAAPVVGRISFAGYVQGIGGTGMATATGLDFVDGATGTPNPGTPGGITSFGAGTGSFAGAACASVGGNCGSIQDILNFATFTPTASFLTLNLGSSGTLTVDLNSIDSLVRSPDATGGSLALSGTGVFHLTGFDNTAALFSLTTQGSQLTSFSATASAIPEPVSWSLMIAGLGAIGYAVRRRRIVREAAGHA